MQDCRKNSGYAPRLEMPPCTKKLDALSNNSATSGGCPSHQELLNNCSHLPAKLSLYGLQ